MKRAPVPGSARPGHRLPPLRPRDPPGRPLFQPALQATLLDACAHLADALLSACPHLRILATSRQALGLTGETVWRVPSLSLPEASGVRRQASEEASGVRRQASEGDRKDAPSRTDALRLT